MAVGALSLNSQVLYFTSFSHFPFPISLNNVPKSSSFCSSTGLQRCGKSCRLRWINYLRPDLKRGPFSQQEEDLIIELHAVLGNRFVLLFRQAPSSIMYAI